VIGKGSLRTTVSPLDARIAEWSIRAVGHRVVRPGIVEAFSNYAVGRLGAMRRARGVVGRIPFSKALLSHIYLPLLERRFQGSERYWIQRYAKGGNSGAGSYDDLAGFKAEFLNTFVERHGVSSVIEHGVGDGNQLSLARYPRYLGLDVSADALARCRERFEGDDTKRFALVREHSGDKADLALSLDVIYHLVEDQTYDQYMTRLFESADSWVIIYSSDREEQDELQPPHVRHRRFSAWVDGNASSWLLVQHVPNRYPLTEGAVGGSFAEFFVYAAHPGPAVEFLP